MTKKNVILTGSMGTGKTTVGGLLARNMKYEFINTDRFIEEQCSMSIPAFLEMETLVAKNLGSETHLLSRWAAALCLIR